MKSIETIECSVNLVYGLVFYKMYMFAIYTPSTPMVSCPPIGLCRRWRANRSPRKLG